MGWLEGRVSLGPVTPLVSDSRSARRRADWFGLGVLALFALTSVWLIGLNLWYSTHQHLVWLGIDGEYPIDQLQYLAWIGDAAHHVLVSDLFTARTTPHDYLQPMVAISGALAAAGVAPWLALLVWKPIAILALFAAVRSYCGRLLPSAGQRNAALVVALFAASFNVLEDEWIPFQSWGYPFDLLSLAALIGALILYDRSRTGATGMIWPIGLAALASWLHPWQGELLIVLLVGSEAYAAIGALRAGARRMQSGRRLILPATTILAAAAPLAYYAALGSLDPAWRLGQTASQQSWPLGKVVLPLLPLLIVSLPGYLRRPAGFLDLTVRGWPLAAFAVWAVNQTPMGAWSVYAWVGITIPLGILAVQGSSRWTLAQRPWVAGLAVAALTIPGSYAMLRHSDALIAPSTGNQNLVSHSERAALAYLAADRLPGSVLSPFPIGDAVPAETGRQTFVGDNRWSPRYGVHNRRTWQLMHGQLSSPSARSFVRRSSAQFILAPCGSRALAGQLGDLVVPIRRFGCLRLYRVR
jgi:hypothetical protein